MKTPLTKHEPINAGRLIQARFLDFTAHIDPWSSTDFVGLICVRARFKFTTLLDLCSLFG